MLDGEELDGEEHEDQLKDEVDDWGGVEDIFVTYQQHEDFVGNKPMI
jgi:hypothetical protein